MHGLNAENITSQNLDHLGIVAGVLKSVRLKEIIDATLGNKAAITGRVTAGDCACAMILNGLGFANRALYLVSHFFENKPIDRLLSSEISAQDLTDDTLGMTLDVIADHDPTKFYAQIAYRIALENHLMSVCRRLDSTSFSLEGTYSGFDEDSAATGPEIISITHGHSKQHRPDLKQAILNLVNTGVSGFPIWAEALSGNSSDKTSFHETIGRIHKFQQEFNLVSDILWIADSALYSKKALLSHEAPWKWITRVPETISEAKNLLKKPDNDFSWQDAGEGYRLSSLCPLMEGVRQRWILVFSYEAYFREKKTFERNLKLESERLKKALWHLGNKPFACSPDAEKALAEVMKKYGNFQATREILSKACYAGKGKPKKGEVPTKIDFFIKASHKKNDEKIAQKLATKGRFILATNELNADVISDIDVLKEYKGLSKVERGFRFLKDPMFMVDQVFLKKPKRIMALMSIMAMTLMIYTLGEHKLREALHQAKETLPNQLKQEVQNPTLRWVFQMMAGISVVTVNAGNKVQRFITNITDLHKRILRLFGAVTEGIYGLLPSHSLPPRGFQ